MFTNQIRIHAESTQMFAQHMHSQSNLLRRKIKISKRSKQKVFVLMLCIIVSCLFLSFEVLTKTKHGLNFDLRLAYLHEMKYTILCVPACIHRSFSQRCFHHGYITQWIRLPPRRWEAMDYFWCFLSFRVFIQWIEKLFSEWAFASLDLWKVFHLFIFLTGQFFAFFFALWFQQEMWRAVALSIPAQE